MNECNNYYNGGCDANARCENEEGTFTCTCNDNYAGDGFRCGQWPRFDFYLDFHCAKFISDDQFGKSVMYTVFIEARTLPVKTSVTYQRQVWFIPLADERGVCR